MRERTTALGGTFEAGPSADGFRVEARLPLEPEPAEQVR
jgi:signal transduction histidine kinase